MNYLDRAPHRPPYIRLDGQDCTLFAVRTKALDPSLDLLRSKRLLLALPLL